LYECDILRANTIKEIDFKGRRFILYLLVIAEDFFSIGSNEMKGQSINPSNYLMELKGKKCKWSFCCCWGWDLDGK
jgi:hypothetical protein